MELTFFRELSLLVKSIRETTAEFSQEVKRTQFVEVLKRWGYTEEQARLFITVVFSQNADVIAEGIEFNGNRIIGNWIRGEQSGNVGSYLKTMKETWSFKANLNYSHIVETDESFISTGPYFQSSYSGPKKSEEGGIWAPPDAMDGQLKIFVVSFSGKASTINLEWVEKERYAYSACKLNGLRFSKE